MTTAITPQIVDISSSSNNSAVKAQEIRDDYEDPPTSPLQRTQSLEKQLQHRPGAKDLKERGILKDTGVAPSLQSIALDLERNRATDSLKKGLAQRPVRDELIERNIIPSTASTIAPSLQFNARELEKRMRRDSLEKQLQARPTQEELVGKGLLASAGNDNVIREE